MWTLLSTLGGYIVALIPRLMDRWQDKADKEHELEIMQMQMRQQALLAEKGYSPADKAEEVRTDSAQDNQQYMEQMAMVYGQQERLVDKAGQWVKDWTAFTRPGVTFILVTELFLINILSMVWIFVNGDKIGSVQDYVAIMEVVFNADEMAMLGTIIAMWFGSRGAKK